MSFTKLSHYTSTHATAVMPGTSERNQSDGIRSLLPQIFSRHYAEHTWQEDDGPAAERGLADLHG